MGSFLFVPLNGNLGYRTGDDRPFWGSKCFACLEKAEIYFRFGFVLQKAFPASEGGGLAARWQHDRGLLIR
jgi:hypothetical protein